MKKKRKKKTKKLFYIIVLIVIIYYTFNIINKFYFNNSILSISSNSSYSGIGQEFVKNKDGYFTTFTTTEEQKKKYIEYKQNGQSSWAKNEYWNGTMEENGCGITAMSIILSGYGFEVTPEDLRKKYFPVLDYSKLSKELYENYGIKNSDFLYANAYFSKDRVIEHLLSNRPILICVLSDGKANRWTSKSHYMVLLATDGKNMVYVSNPNGLQNEKNSSGWYDFKYVIPFIAKGLYVESY